MLSVFIKARSFFHYVIAQIAESRWLPRIIISFYPRIKSAFGEKTAARFRHYPVSLIRYMFPVYGPSPNLHALGLDIRIDRGLSDIPSVHKYDVCFSGPPVRVGVVGALSGNLSTPAMMFEKFPENHELQLFDLALNDEHYLDVSSLSGISVHRMRLSTDSYESDLYALADRINAADLDVLLVAHYLNEQKLDIINVVKTPCILNFSTGSLLCFHPKVDYTLFFQPRKDFYAVGNRLYSVYTKDSIWGEQCRELSPFFDTRGLDVHKEYVWEEREPLIFFHGSLYKMSTPSFLECIADVLDLVPDARFEFLGHGDAEPILEFFYSRGLSNRVSYLGGVGHSQGASETWIPVRRKLAKARLAPNPWPVGGGSARLETYLSATPSVHLRMQKGTNNLYDQENQTLYDLPALEVPTSTTSTIAEYKEACVKCLTNREYAAEVVKEQKVIAKKCTDSEAWWQDFLDTYSKWAKVAEPNK